MFCKVYPSEDKRHLKWTKRTKPPAARIRKTPQYPQTHYSSIYIRPSQKLLLYECSKFSRSTNPTYEKNTCFRFFKAFFQLYVKLHFYGKYEFCEKIFAFLKNKSGYVCHVYIFGQQCAFLH